MDGVVASSLDKDLSRDKRQTSYYRKSSSFSRSTYTYVERVLKASSSRARDTKGFCRNPLYYGYAQDFSDTDFVREKRFQCGRDSVPDKSDWKHIYERALLIIEGCDAAKCTPREVVVKLPRNGSGLIFPDCVIAKRCEGCCGASGSCTAVKTSTKNFQVIESEENTIRFLTVPVEVHDECVCQELCNRRCPPGFTLDSTSCTCLCTRDCGSTGILDSAKCTCKPQCAIYCNYPFIKNEEECRCECGLTQSRCKPGEVLDYSSCRCVCNRDCGPNGVLDVETCTCKPTCTLFCNYPYVRNEETCRCECGLTQSRCKPGEVVDYSSCRCVCNRDCGANGVLDVETCTCKPTCTLFCNYPYVRNEETCRCECELTQSRCKPGEVVDYSSCRCVCNRDCGRNGVLDVETCTCKPTCTLFCNYPYVRNEETCRCECGLTQSSCRPGESLDISSCSCRCQRDCGSTGILDPQTCTCRPRCTLFCRYPFVRNDEACQCECSLSPSSCLAGTRLDTSQCKCIDECDAQSLYCNADQTVDYSKCECVCNEVRQCPGYEVFNRNTCGCECGYTFENPPYCPVDTKFDPCECQCMPEDE
ncbi:balbiani ring protein 3-like isoform X2 [Artemia franciscana]|uniref:balbiani ring protein 3-like isoform X2 n=1 Tax=Artemia franciscana TaxID=6661 RepID=UPI0032DB696A